jgi:hypothetical protein
MRKLPTEFSMGVRLIRYKNDNAFDLYLKYSKDAISYGLVNDDVSNLHIMVSNNEITKVK